MPDGACRTGQACSQQDDAGWLRHFRSDGGVWRQRGSAARGIAAEGGYSTGKGWLIDWRPASRGVAERRPLYERLGRIVVLRDHVAEPRGQDIDSIVERMRDVRSGGLLTDVWFVHRVFR